MISSRAPRKRSHEFTRGSPGLRLSRFGVSAGAAPSLASALISIPRFCRGPAFPPGYPTRGPQAYRDTQGRLAPDLAQKKKPGEKKNFFVPPPPQINNRTVSTLGQ